MTFYSIMESISHLGKMARTSAKSENPNAPVVNRRVRVQRDYHDKKSH